MGTNYCNIKKKIYSNLYLLKIYSNFLFIKLN